MTERPFTGTIGVSTHSEQFKGKVEMQLEVTDGVIKIRTLYQMLGGGETIGRLVDAFYSRVAVDPDLSPIFPSDLTQTREKQFRFLTQLTGGPPLHAELYGPPRLRARHLRFPITPRRAEAWIRCMSSAMDDIELEGPGRDQFFERLRAVAHNMVNTEDENG